MSWFRLTGSAGGTQTSLHYGDVRLALTRRDNSTRLRDEVEVCIWKWERMETQCNQRSLRFIEDAESIGLVFNVIDIGFAPDRMRKRETAEQDLL